MDNATWVPRILRQFRFPVPLICTLQFILLLAYGTLYKIGGDYYMGKKDFNDEEIEILMANPYTAKVTTTQLSFTQEFKELFWASFSKGVPAETILRKHGYDPAILGKNRINGIKYHISKQFNSTPEEPSYPPDNWADAPDATEAIKRLAHEVEYLRQEVEFLKKISSIGTSKK